LRPVRTEGKRSRWLSASTSASLTPGSSSSNSIRTVAGFSLARTVLRDPLQTQSFFQ
jgi:hypothetical protein